MSFSINRRTAIFVVFCCGSVQLGFRWYRHRGVSRGVCAQQWWYTLQMWTWLTWKGTMVAWALLRWKGRGKYQDQGVMFELHPQSLTWNPENWWVSNCKLLFQQLIFRCHVKCQGCKCHYSTPCWLRETRFLLIGCWVVSSVGKFPYHRVPCHVGHLLRHSPAQMFGCVIPRTVYCWGS